MKIPASLLAAVLTLTLAGRASGADDIPAPPPPPPDPALPSPTLPLLPPS